MTVKFWVNQTFLEYTEEQLAVAQLPEEISNFLLRYGLPNERGSFAAAGVKFFPASEFYQVIDDYGTYTVIGKWVENLLSIHNVTGEVYFFAPEETIGSRVYVNLNVQTFLVFHQMFFEELEAKCAGLESEADYQELVNELRQKFAFLDPQSVGEPGSFWEKLFDKFGKILV